MVTIPSQYRHPRSQPDPPASPCVDEEGLSFVIDGNRVTIRLSLARMGDNGEIATYTVDTTVTCRNGAVL